MQPDTKSTFLYSLGLVLLILSFVLFNGSRDAGVGSLVMVPLSLLFFFISLVFFLIARHYSKKIIKNINDNSDFSNPRKERTTMIFIVGVVLVTISYFVESPISIYVGGILILISAYQYFIIKFRRR